MDKELEKQLAKRFPMLFADYGGDPRKTCMAWGCDHGNGWFNIVEAMCVEIQQYVDAHPGMEVVFQQIKEKFATLTVYHNGDDAVYDIVNKYSEMSAKTCEVCGKPGEVITTSGWWVTRCPECEMK